MNPPPHLHCRLCGYQTELAPRFGGCPACARDGQFVALEVAYPSPPAAFTSGARMLGEGLWRWRELLPPVAAPVSLGEGDTALLPLEWEGQRLLLKNETTNPTWCWKDQPNTASVSLAKAWGFAGVAAISTGNHGGAMAAYAGAAGLRARVFCNPKTSPLQPILMRGYGADVELTDDGGARMRALLLENAPDAEGLASGRVHFPCTVLESRAGFSNPYGVEGFKTIAFEVCEALGWRAPERVYIPVGSGDGFYGVWKGFRELYEFGLIPSLPRLFACQSSGADSLARAFDSHAAGVAELDGAASVALSIVERATGDHALRALRASGGAPVVVSDAEIMRVRGELQRRGFALEPASACALAAFAAHTAKLPLRRETAVVIASGSAVKWPECLA